MEMVVEPLEIELGLYLMVYSLRGVGHIVEYNLDRYLHMQKVELGMGSSPGTYSRRRRESLYWLALEIVAAPQTKSRCRR